MSNLAQSQQTILSQLLEGPQVLKEVRSLPAPLLAKLIQSIGLEDAGEVIAYATFEQLSHVLDEDLWRSSQPGEPEAFDGARFSLWLSVLQELGPKEAARSLLSFDETFLSAAFSRIVRVFDSDELALLFESQASEGMDGEHYLFEKALEDCPYHEFDSYLVIARNETGWDALIDILTSMADEYHGAFTRIMTRCAKATAGEAEAAGGYGHLLTADQELMEDVAGEREERREAAGFVAPLTAKSFLRAVALETSDSILAQEQTNPVIESYLRPTRRLDVRNQQEFRGEPALLTPWGQNLASLLSLQEPLQAAAKSLPLAAETPDWLLLALQQLRRENLPAYDERKQELTFLANVLVAADNTQGRRLRPAEAAEKVLEICRRGLYQLGQRAPERQLSVLHERNGAVLLFRLGYGAAADAKMGGQANRPPLQPTKR